MAFSDVLGGINAAGKLLGGILSINQSNKNRKAQQRENQLDRDFNAEQARLNREFQTQMFHAENEYNDPSNIVSRLQRAGINPATAFGSMVQSSSSAPSGSSASFNGSVTPTSGDYSLLGSIGDSSLQSEMIKANKDLAEANADKIRAETRWVDRLNNQQEKLLESGWRLNNITADKESYRYKETIDSNIDNIIANTEQVRKLGQLTDKEIEIASSEASIKEVEAKYADSRYSAEVETLLAKAKLDKSEAYRVCALVMYEQNLMAAQTGVAQATAKSINFDNAFTYSKLRQFGLDNLSKLQVDEAKAALKNLENVQSNIDRGLDLQETSIKLNAVSSIGAFMLDFGKMALTKGNANPHVRGFR